MFSQECGPYGAQRVAGQFLFGSVVGMKKYLGHPFEHVTKICGRNSPETSGGFPQWLRRRRCPVYLHALAWCRYSQVDKRSSSFSMPDHLQSNAEIFPRHRSVSVVPELEVLVARRHGKKRASSRIEAMRTKFVILIRQCLHSVFFLSCGNLWQRDGQGMRGNTGSIGWRYEA